MLRMIKKAISKVLLLLVAVIALRIGIYLYIAWITTSFTFNPVFASQYSAYGSKVRTITVLDGVKEVHTERRERKR